MIVALVCGAGVGLGCWLVLRGLFPPRVPLAAALARLQGRVPAPAGVDMPGGQGLATAIGSSLASGLAGLGIEMRSLRRDLLVTGRSWERHLAEKVALAFFGLVLAPATAAVMALGGVSLPLALPVWASVALALGGWFGPDLGVRAEAAARRRDFRHALGSRGSISRARVASTSRRWRGR